MAANPTVVFVAPRRVEVQDWPVPKPGAGEVLIRTRCTLISTGTELSCLLGDVPRGQVWENYGSYPSVPGYSNVGTVTELGEGVPEDWLGRRVASWGSHAAFVTRPLSNCWPLGDGVADEDAAFSTLALVALNGVRRSQLIFGEAAAVYGLGIVGQLTARICRFAGARPVIGIDLSEHRLGFLPEQIGFVRLRADRDVQAGVSEATAGRMADVVFEVTGSPDVIPREFAVLHPQGRCVILSSPLSATKSFDFHDLCNSPSFTIIGAHNFSHPEHATRDNPWTMRRHTEFFFDLLAAGEMEVAGLVTRREPVGKAPEVYASLVEGRGREMGVVLTFPAG